MPAFYMPLTPLDSDIDELGHVNNAVYVRWLQEVATAHWRSVAPPEAQARFLWVVSRHEIDYRLPTGPGERLTAETWGENPRGARFDRVTRMTGADGRPRVEARTTWVLMDATSLRPARVPAELIRLFRL